MNRNIDYSSVVNRDCDFQSYNRRLSVIDALFECVIILFIAALFLSNACSLAAEVASSSSDQSDPFSEFGKKASDRAVKVVNGVEFAFRWCPPGSFLMGSPESENGRHNNEEQHQVTLTQGFWMMETEVTVGMFKAFVAETGYESKGATPKTIVISPAPPPPWRDDVNLSWANPGFDQDDRSPVSCVSWDDAMAFCKWLESKLGKNVQLPTEKHWEYACRAGTKDMFAGNLNRMAWFWDNSNNSTHQVGTKLPNNFGLYDMHGNVWEWCIDVYDTSLGVGARARRGGGMGSGGLGCRSARRYITSKNIRCADIGFRCAIIPDPPPINIDWGDGTQAGERKSCTVKGVEFAFRWCPPGTFTMGSPESETGRKNDEQQHQVTLTKGFWMMETEVTQDQWQTIMNHIPSTGQGNVKPIGNISWNECQLFCQKCTKLGLPIQLPTEAQWEYACRAGTTEAFAGDIEEMGWFRLGPIRPVRLKIPNEWGLYDMYGNVYELCSDWYSSYSPNSVTDPEGPNSGSHRVMRGGCVSNNTSNYCRSANRGKCVSDYKNGDIGFRCVIGKGIPSTYVPKSSVKPKSKVTRINNFGQGTKPGERKTAVINGVTFAFRWCPPGTFTMGSPESERGRKDDEKQHQVTLTKGFWMMETEVTQEQWKAVMGNNPSAIVWDKLPVERVNWNECQEFCTNCTKLGLTVQLPTEAQWEYACRAGTTETHAGNFDEMAWHCSNSGGRNHPAGKKKPNAWGLYDMYGNVCEWCQDLYGEYPNGNVTDPVGLSSNFNRVGRGGSRSHNFNECQSARRYNENPELRSYGWGFRCVIP